MLAEVYSRIKLHGLSEADIAVIERDLTYKNPQYAKVMRYSKWSTTNVPKFLEYFRIYEENGEYCAEVPIGYSKIDTATHLKVEDYRVYNTVKFPKFLMELRTTQQEALEAYIKCNQFPIPIHGSVQLPTGKGKTVLGIAIANHFRCKTLVIVHKTDLVKSWMTDIEKAFGGKADIGLIKAKSRKVGKHFTIATVQTLNNLTPQELGILYETFDLVIQDEMHHCPSSSFEIGNNFHCRYRLGLTATPERTDGLAHIMNLHYGGFCYRYDEEQKKNHLRGEKEEPDEDILQVEVLRRDLPTFFDPICNFRNNRYRVKDIEFYGNFTESYEPTNKECRVSEIPYNQRPDISHLSIDGVVVSRPETKGKVCREIFSEYNKGHSCIAFFTQKVHITEYRDYLVESFGVPVEDIGLYYGDNKDCDSVLERAESQRKFITLATYSKATEGTNVKQWEVAFLVSSINNGKNTEQAVGRIRRRFPEGDKLEVARLYDYRYNEVYQMAHHGATRDGRYTKLKFNQTVKRRGLFSRGYR